MIKKYVYVDYPNDVEEGVSDYNQYGKAVFRPVAQDIERNDMIVYSNQEDEIEFKKNIRIWEDALHGHKLTISGIV